jgi:hypothetical protein
LAGDGSAAPPSPIAFAPVGAPPRRTRRRRYLRRLVGSVSIIGFVLVVGTLGIHLLEGASYLNAFYFECMLATGQGPPFALTTAAGKLFASVMAFVSIGSVITGVVFILGPLLGRLWREGIDWAEEEARKVERRLEGHRGGGERPPP